MAYQFTQTGQEIQGFLDLVEDNAATIPAYHSGDTVVIGLEQHAGSFVANNTVRWFLPLAKPVGADVSSVAISAGNWVVRTLIGQITIDGVLTNWSVSGLTSIEYGIRPNGIYFVCVAPQSQSGINNTPVAVQTGSTFAITFS